jgi:hypothetical protein
LRNQFVDSRSAKDIDKQVEKILQSIGNPVPPLNLDLVRELLKLDRKYYTSTDDGALREFAHKVKLGAKQVMMRPGLIIDVVKNWDLKALYLPDQKRILIDSSLPATKQRWSESHEIIHSVLPWHQDTTFGDNKGTLTPACYEELEWEANYGAGQLLFLHKHFQEQSDDLALNLKSFQNFGKQYGNSLTTTLWRVVEGSRFACFGAIHAHPWRPPDDFNPAQPIRYLIQSRNYAAVFPKVTEIEIFDTIRSYCSGARGGPLGESTTVFEDLSGERFEFSMETFYNQHDALTLGVCRRKQTILVPVAQNVFV